MKGTLERQLVTINHVGHCVLESSHVVSANFTFYLPSSIDMLGETDLYKIDLYKYIQT